LVLAHDSVLPKKGVDPWFTYNCTYPYISIANVQWAGGVDCGKGWQSRRSG